MKREQFGNTKLMVVKVGTSVVTREDGTLALGRIASLVEQIAELIREGKQVHTQACCMPHHSHASAPRCSFSCIRAPRPMPASWIGHTQPKRRSLGSRWMQLPSSRAAERMDCVERGCNWREPKQMSECPHSSADRALLFAADYPCRERCYRHRYWQAQRAGYALPQLALDAAHGLEPVGADGRYRAR